MPLVLYHPMFRALTKHIEIDYHFVRDMVLRKDFVIQYVCSDDQLADILTKHLSSARFRAKLTVLPRPFRLSRDDSYNHASACNWLL